MRLRSDLAGIAAFAETVTAGSFTAAAERLGLSKSAVGKSVARLEAQLGVRLLDRTTRSLSLTDEGRRYFELCARVLSELEEGEQALATQRGEISGRLRVSLPVSFGRLWVMPVLTRLAEENPKLSLDVSFTDRMVDVIDEGLDLVVRLGDAGNQSSLMSRSLGTHLAVLCAAPAYLERRGVPGTMRDLAGHDCIGFATGERSFAAIGARPDGQGAIKIVPRHVVSDGEALRQATLAGLGLAYLPTWMVADALEAGTLRAVLHKEPIVVGPILAIWPKPRAMLPKVRAGIDALVAGFLPRPPWSV
jgi:DNA-binding transcriptional LysR family regulator